MQAEIEKALPVAGSVGVLQGSPVVQELWKLCDWSGFSCCRLR